MRNFRIALVGATFLAWTIVGAWPIAVSATYATSVKKLTAANWDGAEQRLVVRDAVMSEAAGDFHGAAPLGAADERGALSAIATRRGVAPIAFDAGAPLTVVRFDALLVDQLGLGEVAQHVQQVATDAGLSPPGYFGSEVVARYLGLRYDHPAGEDRLELYPWNRITRAEAAHSFAVVLGFLPAPPDAGSAASGETPESAGEATGTGEEPGTGEATGTGELQESPPPTPSPAPSPPASWALADARETLMAFSLPAYNAAQREVLRLAVSKIGMPYVWGGTTDNTADGLEHGGYDCSGFAWRVYKVSGLSWGKQILGRTAAEQAGEIPKRRRLHLPEVAGGDLLFFGSAHFDSTATNANVIHEGIALSSQWAINSSGQGVYVLPLTSGWLHDSFTWGRRVL